MRLNPSRIQRVLVAIATYRRPEELARLLDSLDAQRVADGRDVRVVVVDNDPLGSARRVCEGRSLPPIYDHEPEPGISAARNRGVSHRGDASAVAFIDDDEIAAPHWLESLIRVAESTGAHVVSGPVVPTFPTSAPKWIVRQGWFTRPGYKTGQRVKWPATNNSLVQREVLDALGPDPFDRRFALTGGEDADFFDRSRSLGAVMLWSAEATVTEPVDESRLSMKWLWQRNVRLGNISGINLRKRHSAPYVLAVGLARSFVGAVAALPVLIFAPHQGGRVIGNLPRGVGTIGVIFGARVIEYARATGEERP